MDAPDPTSRAVLLNSPRTTTSTNAGSYYCGHIFYALHHRARLSRTPDGHVRAGFLHVPREPALHVPPPPEQRFATLRLVLDAALAGAADELAANDAPLRLLLTGFGAFLDVADNITGAFLAHHPSTDALAKAHPSLSLAFLTMPVDDRCLDATYAGSIERAVSAHSASAVIAMGVARSRVDFTVESVPDDAGLADEGRLQHARGRPVRRRGPAAPWLADCVRRGAALRR